MRYPKRALLCVLALAAVGLGASTAHAALPEFLPPGGIPFTSTSGKSTFETVSKFKIVCAADTGKGETTGPKSLTMSITFTGCVTGTAPCNSPNGLAGEIVTTLLFGKLGYIVSPTTPEVGVDLSSPTGAPIMEFVCGPSIRGVVQGSVIGQITPVNKLRLPPKPFTLKFKQKKGKQAITHLFGEPVDVLMTSLGGPLIESGLTSAEKVKFAAPVQINA